MKKQLQKWLFMTASVLFSAPVTYAQWSSISPIPSSGVGNDGAVSFTINGKGYIVGGSSTGKVFAYDTVSHAWTFIDTMPSSAGHAFAMSFVINNKGYVVGGDTAGMPVNTVWEFDPSLTGNHWTQKGDFTPGVRDAGFGFALNGSGYVGAGNDNVYLYNDIWKYNVTGDSWTQLPVTLPVNGLIFPTTFVIGNKGYITGGGISPSGVNEVNSLWCLDNSNDSIYTKASFPGTARQASLAFSNNAYGFVGGGQANYTTNYYDMWSYNAANNHWTQVTNTPLLGAAWSSSFVIGNTAYAGLGAKFQGSGLTGNLNFYKYNMSVVTGIEEDIDNSFPVSLYPNPASDFLTIETPGNKSIQVEIYSATGEKVMSRKIENAESISVADLSQGIYFVKIISGDKMSVRKIQIIK